MWFTLAVLAGMADAFRDAAAKRAARNVPGLLVAWSYVILTLPFFVPALFAGPEQEIPHHFWGLLSAISLLHVLGNLLLVEALRISELSLCTPMVAFSPVFLLVIGPLLIGEIPTLPGLFGTLLVVSGSYILNLSNKPDGWLEPLRAIFYERGVQLMLAVALIWSMTSSIDRLAIPLAGRNFWAGCQLLSISLLSLPFILKRVPAGIALNKQKMLALLPVGLLNALGFLFYLGAVVRAPVLYVLCLKRLSILFSLLLARIFFEEQLTKARIAGASVMLAGVVTISLWG